MDEDYFGDTMRELAAGVLRQAVTDQEVEFETIELWCAVVDLDPALFQEKLKGIISSFRVS